MHHEQLQIVDDSDNKLIDIDTTTLRDAILGGLVPEPEELQRSLQAIGMPFPCRVLVAYAKDAPPSLIGAWQQAGVLVLDQLHPGLLYAFADDRGCLLGPAEEVGLFSGEDIPCDGPSQFTPAVQQAIISLRYRELEGHRSSGTEPDHASERAARDQALHAVQTRGDMAALELWLELILYRHRHRLVAVRRRMLEFLALLGAELDCMQAYDRALQLAVQQLMSTYAFPELRTRFPQLVDELLPFLSQGSGRRSALVASALELIEERHAEGIALSELAAALQVSPEHLSRQVKRETGRSVTELLHALRLASAKRLLVESDEGILQIALACGFPSVEHFHRFFKRATGTTPRRWRLSQN